MLNNIIQSLSAYAEALEQKLSALEQRVSNLQLTVNSLQATNEQLQSTINTLQSEIAALAAEGIVANTTEPEVEIELIVEESDTFDESDNKPITEGPNAEEPQEIPEQLEPLEILEPLEAEEPQEEPVKMVTEEPKTEVVVEQSAPQPQPEPQSVPKVEPAPRPMPQQTSLFGTAVEDIRQAISLGDRFLFQRELFAGNGELMQKTLDELNALGSLSEAMDYVLDNFEWDKESTAVQLFENVLKRRFS